MAIVGNPLASFVNSIPELLSGDLAQPSTWDGRMQTIMDNEASMDARITTAEGDLVTQAADIEDRPISVDGVQWDGTLGGINSGDILNEINTFAAGLGAFRVGPTGEPSADVTLPGLIDRVPSLAAGQKALLFLRLWIEIASGEATGLRRIYFGHGDNTKATFAGNTVDGVYMDHVNGTSSRFVHTIHPILTDNNTTFLVRNQALADQYIVATLGLAGAMIVNA